MSNLNFEIIIFRIYFESELLTFYLSDKSNFVKFIILKLVRFAWFSLVRQNEIAPCGGFEFFNPKLTANSVKQINDKVNIGRGRERERERFGSKSDFCPPESVFVPISF